MHKHSIRYQMPPRRISLTIQLPQKHSPKQPLQKTWAVPASIRKLLLEKADEEEDKESMGTEADGDDEKDQKLEEEKELADENIAWDICLRCRAVEKVPAKVEITLNEEEREACVRAADRWKEMKAEMDMRIATLEMCIGWRAPRDLDVRK